MPASPSDRIQTLDLIRGVAVLGILAVNITSFAAPGSASYSPNQPAPGSAADNWAFAAMLVLFEGKMRALFSILFGASLLLYLERKDEAGLDGQALQVRRLLWLALFGLLHFALFWDGDILFLYACVGLGALLLRHPPGWQLAMIAVLVFTVWQAWGVSQWTQGALLESRVAAGAATSAERAKLANIIATNRTEDREDTRTSLSSYTTEMTTRLTKHPDYPLAMLAYNWGETLSYVLIGMALLKSAFFAGGWPRKWLWGMALGGTGAGLALTLAFTAWAHPAGYPEQMMHLMIRYGLSFPHLLTTLGYAALLVLAAPRLLASGLGQRFAAAGQMAFTNYIACTVLMCFLFYGWGLGLFGQYGAAGQWLFVALGWALMLAWSKPWLDHFRQGPLEWLWRSLTEGKRLPLWR